MSLVAVQGHSRKSSSEISVLGSRFEKNLAGGAGGGGGISATSQLNISVQSVAVVSNRATAGHVRARFHTADAL